MRLGACVVALLTTAITVWTMPTPARAGADRLIAASDKAHVPLIELYTSEGCSSCPAADAWLGKLQQRSDLWTTFVPVAFHVNYWNDLGWIDQLSSERLTQRQVDLAKAAKASVYTPGFFVDGREWQAWRAAGDSLPDALPKTSPEQTIGLRVTRDAGGTFHVKATGLAIGKRYVAHLALLGMGIKTSVARGENAGRKLEHNFAVLDWEKQTAEARRPEMVFTFDAAAQTRAEAKLKATAARLALDAWIEEDSVPRPLQAAGGFL